MTHTNADLVLLARKEDAARVPNPSHRHAAPSAPWPWVDLSDDVDPQQLSSDLPPVPHPCDHSGCDGECWKNYPESRFPNWTKRQVRKSKILKAVEEYDRSLPCTLYYVDVDAEGRFHSPDETTVRQGNFQGVWKFFVDNKRPSNLRVRALFVENLSGPVLQMLGARFNIEPFFWSSSLNWIPSRYQEDPHYGVGDHITICLTFLRSMPENTDALRMDANARKSFDSTASARPSTMGQQMIDTQAPLPLSSSGQLLVLDLLSVHLIRSTKGSTIISYHPNLPLPTTTAKQLHERVRFAGQSVYWQNMFKISTDPTFVLLTCLWHAMYAWDEALENLYEHICTIETKVIETNELKLTTELHIIRAHLLHYSSLLEDFRKTVDFIAETPNPGLEVNEQKAAETMLHRECRMLLNEIRRLEMGRKMQDRRLKNVMNLVFSSVNILDSKRMQKMTEAAVRDSAGIMKQIAYLTMVFLPASFVAGVFGMNVREIVPETHGTLPHYIGAAIAMTLLTIWIIVAFQSRNVLPDHYTFLQRLGWPILLILKWVGWVEDDDHDRFSVDASTREKGSDDHDKGAGPTHDHCPHHPQHKRGRRGKGRERFLSTTSIRDNWDQVNAFPEFK